MSKGALGMLSAYWPEDTARYAHIPLQRVTQACVHAPAAGAADRTALASGERSLAYGELAARVTAAAAALRERGEAGQRVAVIAADPLDLVVAGLATLDADRLAWWSGATPAAEALAAFQPELVILGSGSEQPPGALVSSTASARLLRSGCPDRLTAFPFARSSHGEDAR